MEQFSFYPEAWDNFEADVNFDHRDDWEIDDPNEDRVRHGRKRILLLASRVLGRSTKRRYAKSFTRNLQKAKSYSKSYSLGKTRSPSYQGYMAEIRGLAARRFMSFDDEE